MADILYVYNDNIYANLTNKCPCRCSFCIRQSKDAIGNAETLWHKVDPTIDEIKKAVDDFDFTGYKELVFCGYGEPTNALDNLIETAKYVKEKHPDIKLRLNTNGLGNLINERSITKDLSRYIDSVSISLNTCSSEKYDEVCRPIFPNAYEAMLEFAKEAKESFGHTQFSIVDTIPKEDIEECEKIAENMGIYLRIRKYS
jgi:radical SAM enzyme (TIGR04100 family)